MHETLRGVDRDGLERSCGRPSDSIRFGAGAPGIERTVVRLTTVAFEPHRHGTYAIGVTTAGVQVFGYRGERRVGLPGQVHVLHPDELHDGAAGTDAGFSYRILYVNPELVRDALGSRALPFVPNRVHGPGPATAEVRRLLADLDDPISELARGEIAATVADVLVALGGKLVRDSGPIDMAAVARVRDFLTEHAREQTRASALEQVAGLDRYTIARQFRRAYGTSPDRYRTMRRLAIARAAIAGGLTLAAASYDAGFADQSHMTRQFRRAYGLTPGRWAKAIGARRAPA